MRSKIKKAAAVSVPVFLIILILVSIVTTYDADMYVIGSTSVQEQMTTATTTRQAELLLLSAQIPQVLPEFPVLPAPPVVTDLQAIPILSEAYI